MSCASVVVVVVVALPHFLFLSRSLNELSEYLHKIKCCPTSWPARGRRGEEGRQRGDEAAQLSWQTCLKVAARLSRRRGTQRKKERVERKQEGRRRQGRERGTAGVGGLHAPTHKGNGKAAHNKTQIRDEKQQKKKQLKMKQRRQVKKENMFILVAPPPPPVKLLL